MSRIALLALIGMLAMFAGPVQANESCEARCAKNCNVFEVAGCTDDCLAGRGYTGCHVAPEAKAPEALGGFHWPTCRDDWPDCVPPLIRSLAEEWAKGYMLPADELHVEESCYNRCAKCRESGACPGKGTCGDFQCWNNCSENKHPVCCHGCN